MSTSYSDSMSNSFSFSESEPVTVFSPVKSRVRLESPAPSQPASLFAQLPTSNSNMPVPVSTPPTVVLSSTSLSPDSPQKSSMFQKSASLSNSSSTSCSKSSSFSFSESEPVVSFTKLASPLRLPSSAPRKTAPAFATVSHSPVTFISPVVKSSTVVLSSTSLSPVSVSTSASLSISASFSTSDSTSDSISNSFSLSEFEPVVVLSPFVSNSAAITGAAVKRSASADTPNNTFRLFFICTHLLSQCSSFAQLKNSISYHTRPPPTTTTCNFDLIS